MSKGDRYENVSPKEYLNVIRSYLRDLINDHRSTAELNNNNNNDNSNNSNSNDIINSNSNNNNNNSNNNNRAEWKSQLTMQNSGVSTKSFEETCTMYTKSEPVKIFMGSDTEDVIDNFFIHFYKDFKMYKNHQIKEETNLSPIVLNYYIIIFKE